MEQTEDIGSIVPVPVFVDDTGRRRKLTRRVGRGLLVGFTAYIGLLVLGLASDPRLGPLHLPTIGFPDLGLMVPPAPLVLGEQTRNPSAAGIEVSTAGASDGDVRSAAPSGNRPAPSSDGGTGNGTPGPATSGVAPASESRPTGRPPGTGTTTTSTSTTTTTTSRDGNPTSSMTTPTPAAPSTPPTASPTSPGQGPVSAKGPDGSGPPGQQRRATKTTGS